MVFTDNDQCDSISRYMDELIRSKGYPLEIHQVTTEDGYINSIYRIPYGLHTTDQKHLRCPVLIVHGLCSSVADALNVDNQLGYFLADKGFDVWVANCRGTTFSRGHKKYDHIKDAGNYWNFSFHEIGYYDIPAFMDHILRVTGFQKLFYIGVSQGCTTFTVLMSTRPEYNQKIFLSCLLCPAIKFENAKAFPLRLFFVYLVPWIEILSKLSHIALSEAPIMDWIRYFGKNYAKPNSRAEYFYLKFWDLLAGHSNPQQRLKVDYRKLSITSPNTAAMKQIVHFSQVIKGNRFVKYDYGPKENLKMYGTESPPLYNLSKVTAPVGLFYSENDMYYGTQDIDNVADELGNCVLKYLVKNKKFNHMNFMYNTDITPLLYLPTLNLIEKYKQ